MFLPLVSFGRYHGLSNRYSLSKRLCWGFLAERIQFQRVPQRNGPVVSSGALLLCSRSTEQFDSSEDYYAVLGIDKTADLATIKRAYRRLALQNHPDANKDPQAREKFIRILRAYQVLSSVDTRRRYDAQRRWQGSPFGQGFGGTSARRWRSTEPEETPENINDSFGAIFTDLMEQIGRLWQEGTRENGIFADFVEFLENQGANWGSLRNEDLDTVLRSNDESVLQAELDDARFVREQCEERLRMLQQSLDRTDRRRKEWQKRTTAANITPAEADEARARERELSQEIRRLESRIRRVQSLIANQKAREGLLASRLETLRQTRETRAAADEKVRSIQSEVDEELEKLKRELGKF